MVRSLFPRLRRSLLLLLLAIGAWTAMTGSAWAMVDCCGPTQAMAGMADMPSHGDHADHGDRAGHAGVDACPCAHACAAMPRMDVSFMPTPMQGGASFVPSALEAPQPPGSPPLRPPLA